MYIFMSISSETHRHSVAEARRNLPSLIRAAENGSTVEIRRRGVAVAVLVGKRRFDQFAAARPDFAEAYQAFVQNTDLAGLALDPDEIFAGVRDDSPGRKVDL